MGDVIADDIVCIKVTMGRVAFTMHDTPDGNKIELMQLSEEGPQMKYVKSLNPKNVSDI